MLELHKKSQPRYIPSNEILDKKAIVQDGNTALRLIFSYQLLLPIVPYETTPCILFSPTMNDVAKDL